jgi:hypothetical protein
MPDAVPLPLGAPLPSTGQAASFAVAVPEPVGTELGGTLPIFESVESDYFHTRGRDVLRPGEPQAGQPTLAGQPATAPAIWASVADGRRAAASADRLAVGGLTSAGLPQRLPQTNLVPGAAVDREAPRATAAESAQIALGRLASFQQGSRRARAVARMDRDADQSAQDD